MRIYRLFHCTVFLLVGSLAMGFAAVACGGSQVNVVLPDDSRSRVVAGDVLYDLVTDRLVSTVTVTVADSEGRPLSGQLVTLDASRTADIVQETDGLTTDSDGVTVFHVSTDTFGPGTFVATLPDRSLELSEQASVSFILQASTTFGEPTFDTRGATLGVDLVLTDAAGAVVGASVTLLSDRASDSIQPASATTGPGGDASFVLTAIDQGDIGPSLEVSTLRGAIPLDPLTVEGPRISGEISFEQAFGVLTSPRVGLLYIDFDGWSDGLIGAPAELTSVGIEIANGETVGYSLALPLIVPPEDPVHPNEGSFPPDFELAVYIPVVYDDVGTVPGEMDAGDTLVAISSSLPVISWLQGTMPDTVPGSQEGYNMMEMPSGQTDPAIFSWDDWAHQLDLSITMAAVPDGDVGGTIHFGSTIPAGTDMYMELVLLDPAAMEAGNPWDPANHAVLANLPFTYVAGTDVPWSMALPDLPQDPHYDTWTTSLGGGLDLSWLAIILYADVNQNGQWDPGSEPAYSPEQPFGIGQIWLWYMHPGMDWIFGVAYGTIHPGWVVARMPLELHVLEVFPATGRLRLDDTVEPGHTGIAFEVRRDVAGEEVVILSGADLDTGIVESDEVWTTEDVTLVQPGDRLVITQVIDDTEHLPLDSPVDYATD